MILEYKIQLIGLDGGASKIRAWIVEPGSDGFKLQGQAIEKQYASHPDFDREFAPIPIPQQLAEMKGEPIPVSSQEKQQGQAILETILEAVLEITSGQRGPWIIGLGFPGLKTSDKKGIAALVNGPRMPTLACDIELELKKNQIDLATPIHALGSDADYCGLGEEKGKDGHFTGVKNAYYLGGGTGVADALKLHGQVLPFDQIKDWMAKTWELTSNGLSFEKVLSARGIQQQYARETKTPIRELTNQNFFISRILEKAQAGEPEALNVCTLVGENLGLLLFERLETIFCGWQNRFQFINPNRPLLQFRHEYQGTFLERFVIGQRLGTALADDENSRCIRDKMVLTFDHLIEHSTHRELAENYTLRMEKLLTTSSLRDAPVLGAAIDAWTNYRSQTHAY